ncbi:MAG: hypothetical protein QM831_04140 [Kofleriaceae bacterium]
MRSLVVLVVATAAFAAPAQAPYGALFHAKASWKLACEYGTPDHMAAHGDLTCAIDAVTSVGGTKRAHLACTGQDDILDDIRLWTLESRTFVATAKGLWSVDDDGPDDRGSAALTHATDKPPYLSAKPVAGKRQRNDDPDGNSGMWFVTAALGHDWCVGKMPWGWGGGRHVWVMCFAADGAITGISGLKTEARTDVLRCGHAIDPQTIVDTIQH